MLRVNGTGRTVTVEPRTTLADALRDRLGLHGTHLGCEHGVCGSCTVLLDGAPVRSCLLFAIQCRDSEVTTIEGLADGDVLHPLQRAVDLVSANIWKATATVRMWVPISDTTWPSHSAL